MALQGTIETFPLSDVLALLGASSKTGRLELSGDRGSGCLWLDGGSVVGGDVSGRRADEAAFLVFELLRFTDGAFEFTATAADEVVRADLEPTDLVESVDAAQDLLGQWREIEAVVPSMGHVVRLVVNLPTDELTIDAFRWSLIVAAGGARSVAAIAAELDLDDFAASAAVAALVDDGLARIDEAAPVSREVRVSAVEDIVATEAVDADDYGVDGPLDAFGAAVDEVDVVDAQGGADAENERGSAPNRFPIDDLLGDGAMEREDPWSSPEAEQIEAPRRTDDGSLDDGEFGATAAAWNDMVEADQRSEPVVSREDDTADEVLRQMSKLSPKAAEAIAAALSSVPASSGAQARDNDDDSGSDEPSSYLGSF